MMERWREWFEPGPMFGWACAAFLLMIPCIWIQWFRRGHRASVRFSAVSLFDQLGSSIPQRLMIASPVLRTAAIAALIFALARPQSSGGYKAKSEGIAIQMVLDVSGSMAEQDFVIHQEPVRRLDAVKAVFEEFVLGGGALKGRDDDLIGMTTFAMFADSACPLTLDHASLVELLRDTEIPGWVRGQQVRPVEEANYTSIGDAIAVATDVLRRAGEQAAQGVSGAQPAKSRIMILLTDGKNNPVGVQPGMPPSPQPLDAARIAAKLGIRIYTIGAVGSGRAPSGHRFLTPARADVDEPMMREIAAITDGKYFRASDSQSLEGIYGEIDRLERRPTGEREFRDNVRVSTIAMIGALSLLTLEVFLANGRFRRIP